jgi:hypothetical protein
VAEHDDDLESEVHEGAEEETDTFSDTGDELDGPANGGPKDEDDDELDLDDDEAEL